MTGLSGEDEEASGCFFGDCEVFKPPAETFVERTVVVAFWEPDGTESGDDGMEEREEVRWKKSVTFRLGRSCFFATLLIAMIEGNGGVGVWRSIPIRLNAFVTVSVPNALSSCDMSRTRAGPREPARQTRTNRQPLPTPL